MSAHQTTAVRQAGACFIPVNLPLDEAIALHQAATCQQEEWLALQTVLFAATPTVQDLRRQLDYASALPVAAWAWSGRDADAAREAWLRGISRCLTWIMSERTDSNADRAE